MHDVKPPFLDGRVKYTTQQAPVMTVRDPTADLAQIAKRGSRLLREVRETRDRQKATTRFWELAGSTMGAVMGIKKKQEASDTNVSADGSVDYRTSAQFASHIQAKTEAVSKFAQSHSIREQREFLPIFQVRRELLQVIRDNQGMYTQTYKYNTISI